jgi:putative DNA primase/helicase
MTDSPINRVLDALRERDCKPKAKGPGKWEARCPAHEDSKPSLSIGEGTDGRVLVHCFVGCSFGAIVKNLDLEKTDLFADGKDPKPSRKKPSAGSKGSNGTSTKKPPARSKGGNGRGYRTPELALAWTLKELGGGKISKLGPWPYERSSLPTTWSYRIELPDGGKTQRPLHQDAVGGWHLGKAVDSGLPLLYESTLAAADVVYVTEGEPCCDLARGLGLIATTSQGGADAASMSDWSALAGKHVVLLPDFDEPGEKYVGDIAGILTGLDPKPTVKILRLPVKEQGGDIKEWLRDLPDTWGPVEC